MVKRSYDDKQDASPLEEIRNTYVKMLLSSEQLPLYTAYDLEQQSLQCVKDGDVEGARQLFKEEFFRGVDNSGTYSPDALKNMEYKCIVCITLTARAAIESGLTVQGAYAIRNSLFQRAAAAGTVKEYCELCYESFIAFTSLIHHASETASDDPRINQVKEYVRNNIAEKLTVESLANQFCISKEHLSRKFKQSEGTTLKEYINATRIEIAKSFLCYTNCTLPQVADSVGFSSQSHFGKVFKDHTGLTPAEYRLRYKKIYDP